MKISAHTIALTLSLVFFPLVVRAQTAPVAAADVVRAEILPGWTTASGARMAALHLTLADHWKTYWRAPGDAGIPPSFDWTGSANVASVRFHWPRPVVFHLNGMQTVGYMHDLVLPMEVVATDPAKPMQVRGKVDIGVCNDICMPVSLTISADLSGAGARDAVIEAALAKNPVSGPAAGVSAVRCEVRPIKDGVHLTAQFSVPDQGGDETALIETADPTVWVGDSHLKREGGEVTAGADLVPSDGAPFVLDRSGVRITILGSDRAVDIQGCPAG